MRSNEQKLLRTSKRGKHANFYEIPAVSFVYIIWIEAVAESLSKLSTGSCRNFLAIILKMFWDTFEQSLRDISVRWYIEFVKRVEFSTRLQFSNSNRSVVCSLASKMSFSI